MAGPAEPLSFDSYEDRFQEKFEEIKLPFAPQEVVTVQLLAYKRVQSRFFNFVQKPSSVHFVVSCPKVRKRQLRSFTTHDIGIIATGLAKLITSENLINQNFSFVIPKQENHSKESFPINFEVNLDYALFPSYFSGKQTIDAFTLPKDGSGAFKTICFERAKIELKVRMSKTIRTEPDFRYSLGLSQGEKEFRKKRIPLVCKAMKKLLGEKNGPKNPMETPVVSVVGSGGGFRAIEGMCGAMEAFEDSGLMDIITYISGLSGSAWYLTSAYVLKGFKAKEQENLHEGLRYRLQDNSISAVIRPRTARGYEKYLKKSCKKHGQIHTFANYFPGFTIGKQLLMKKVAGHFSETIPYVEDGSVPYPILVALEVKNKIKSSEYSTIMEQTPHELSFPSYGINIRSKEDASTWNHGFCVRQCPEFPLHFTIAMTGCAFAVLLNSYFESGGELDKKFLDYVEDQRLKGKKKAEDNDSDEGINNDHDVASDDDILDDSEETNSEATSSTDQDNYSLSESNSFSSDTNSDFGSQDDLDYDLIEFPDAKSSKFTRLNRATIKEIESKAINLNKEREIGNHSYLCYTAGKNDIKITLSFNLVRAIKKMHTQRENPQFLSRNAIVGRTFQMKNFALGMNEIKRFSLNPLEFPNPTDGNPRDCTYGTEPVKYNLSTSKDYLSIADAGVLNNVAPNVVLRPQRTTDLLIVFDFNAYDSDEDFDYQPLVTAAAHAHHMGIKIPPVRFGDVTNLPPKEFLLFPSTGPDCPTLLWFTLCNKNFKNLKDYVPRSTAEPPDGDTRAFNDFEVFGKGNNFDTLKFYSSQYNFDQLRELMYYNVSSHFEEIKSALLDAVRQKHEKFQQD